MIFLWLLWYNHHLWKCKFCCEYKIKLFFTLKNVCKINRSIRMGASLYIYLWSIDKYHLSLWIGFSFFCHISYCWFWMMKGGGEWFFVCKWWICSFLWKLRTFKPGVANKCPTQREQVFRILVFCRIFVELLFCLERKSSFSFLAARAASISTGKIVTQKERGN